MNLKYFKQKIQDNINGYYYAIFSNIIRSTFFHIKFTRKNILIYLKIFFIPVTIDTIGLCNARCKFCSYRISDRPKEIIELKKFKSWAYQAKNLGFSRLNLTPINGEFF